MKQEFTTKDGVYEYEEVRFPSGEKYLNVEISRKNLLNFKKFLDKNGLTFGLIFGTLLGAVREGNFIEHDEDTDVYILYEYRDDFVSLLFGLREIGFEVVRYEDELITIMRGGEYIDVYFFKNKQYGKRVCREYVLEENLLEVLTVITFIGEQFNIPRNYKDFLEKAYGKKWTIPKKGAHAAIGFNLKARRLLKEVLPDSLVNFIIRIKSFKAFWK